MKNERYIAYDIMRIIACFGVIMIHCAVFEQEALWYAPRQEDNKK